MDEEINDSPSAIHNDGNQSSPGAEMDHEGMEA